MREPTERGYYVDPSEPNHPIHAKTAWARGRRLRQITQAEAEALTAALRGGEACQLIQPPPEPIPVPPPAQMAQQLPVHGHISEAARREAAKERVRKAVADVNHVTNEQQMRFEGALMAKNKNIGAMEGLVPESRVHGITVEELADRIIAERQAREQLAYQIHAIEAQVLKDIDAASGDAIEELAHQAVASIKTASAAYRERSISAS